MVSEILEGKLKYKNKGITMNQISVEKGKIKERGRFHQHNINI
jgi:hypothetical protein